MDSHSFVRLMGSSITALLLWYGSNIASSAEGTQPCRVDLNAPAGWCAFSLPLVPPSRRVKDVLPTASAVYRFNGDYELLSPDDSLEVGEGYWVRHETATNISIEGSPVYSHVREFRSGWNFVGGCSEPAMPAIPDRQCIGGFAYRQLYRFVPHDHWLSPGTARWVYLAEGVESRMRASWTGRAEPTPSVILERAETGESRLSPAETVLQFTCPGWTEPLASFEQLSVHVWVGEEHCGAFVLGPEDVDLSLDPGQIRLHGQFTLPHELVQLLIREGGPAQIRLRILTSQLEPRDSGECLLDGWAVVDSYMAVAPRVLRGGETAAVSISLLGGGEPAGGEVKAALLAGGETVAEAEASVDGRGRLEFTVPSNAEGEHVLAVTGPGFEDQTAVVVERATMLLVETDKPMYRPGQTLYVRVVSLNAELKPVSTPVALDIRDAKGNKVFRRELVTDDFGWGALEMPISSEPNLGVWKISVSSEYGQVETDVRVEKYVLPKYEVSVDMPREWIRVDEPVRGRVSAEYSFGKPVSGRLEIKASRYIGEWEVYETYTAEIDGETDFELPAPGYVVGVPGAGGQGNVTLDVTVREGGTEYEETVNRIVNVAASDLSIQLIPEGAAFKPGLPFGLAVLAKDPAGNPVDAQATITTKALDAEFAETTVEVRKVEVEGGKALLTVATPEGAAALVFEAVSGESTAEVAVQAAYSPSSTFIHLTQTSPGVPAVGELVSFEVLCTQPITTLYYEVVARGLVVFSSFTDSGRISFQTTPAMTPAAKLLAYQLMPDSEVAADCLPFDVQPAYPQQVSAAFSVEAAEPGEDVQIEVSTEGQARVGLSAVDKSVFILARNRVNLQQVFDELERLYMKPEAELHSFQVYSQIETRGAAGAFDESDVVVLSNARLPQGQTLERTSFGDGWWDMWWRKWGEDIFLFDGVNGVFPEVVALADGAPGAIVPTAGGGDALAEVGRVRQFFPETWFWQDVTTDGDGRASLSVQVPDTITTWMLHATAVSGEAGLGVYDTSLKAFQPFFLKLDLPYEAIRGEEFPVQVAVYNYLGTARDVQVELALSDRFDLLDAAVKTVEVDANGVGSAQFMIRPVRLGVLDLRVSARSSQAADAAVRTMLVSPEGVARETVQNAVVEADVSTTFDTSVPDVIVEGSERAYLAATSSLLAQSIEGLDQLLKMPFGCGEQNMICLAPDLAVLRYLDQSGQLKPEIMAKAEKMILTGYQRQLTYRRDDGSFSAFGNSDDEGSLWLTAFVLRVFSQARSIMHIDPSVLDQAADWIASRQNADGSFDPVGFVHHNEMVGGLDGKPALTAFAALALAAAGEEAASARAKAFLEDELPALDDAYAVALVAYCLLGASSTYGDVAYERLMEFGEEGSDGLHWPAGSATIEATGYGTLALLARGDRLNARLAAKWLAANRNARGGFGSTQDTVVALDALCAFAQGVEADVDLTVSVGWQTDEDDGPETAFVLEIDQETFDVLQLVELPVGPAVEVKVAGRGEAVLQVVKRFNLPTPEPVPRAFDISVDYNTTRVEVDDVVTVSVKVGFQPRQPIEAGMVVLDVSVPTGFAVMPDSLESLLNERERIKRYDVAGRKVIFYLEDMVAGEQLAFDFKVRARFPVKAKSVSSEVYSYYQPELRGETLSDAVTVDGE